MMADRYSPTVSLFGVLLIMNKILFLITFVSHVS